MFEGFTESWVQVSGARLHVRVGGQGPALLLIHGHPRTHATWCHVAPLLASSFTVVCPDLRGFGQSSMPPDAPGHIHSSKRAKAADCLELMQQLGYERFGVVGHDRGSYVAFRLAMDHPAAVERLVILEGVPIVEALERCGSEFATRWWHWFFFAQPDKPERAILADPDAWYGLSTEPMGPEAFADIQMAIHNPEVVHGMVEDYRAGLGIDRAHDEADRAAGRRIRCPMLCLWALQDDLPDLCGDVLAIWQPWAPNLQGAGLDCGHHMAEEKPQELSDSITRFMHADL